MVALSGRYDLTRPCGSFPDLFNGHYDQDVYFITPNHFMPGLSDPGVIGLMRSMEITLAVGEHDPFHESNRLLSQTFAEKGRSPHVCRLAGRSPSRPLLARDGSALPVDPGLAGPGLRAARTLPLPLRLRATVIRW